MKGGWKSKPEPLGEVIADYLVRSGLSSRVGADRLGENWAQLVGPELARRTRVVGGLRAGAVRVEVDSPGLLAELKGFRGEELVKGMRERYKRKHIQKLNFVLGTWEKK